MDNDNPLEPQEINPVPQSVDEVPRREESQPILQASQMGSPSQEPASDTPQKKSSLPIIIGAAVAIIAVIVAAVLAITLRDRGGDNRDVTDKIAQPQIQESDDYKKALEMAMEYSMKFDSSNIEKLVPECVWDYYVEIYEEDKESLIADEIEKLEETKEYFAEESGSVNYEILSYEKMDEEDVAELKEALEYGYEIDPDIIDDNVYVAEYRVELVEGSEVAFEEDEEAYICNIDGEWYCVDCNYFFLLG